MQAAPPTDEQIQRINEYLRVVADQERHATERDGSLFTKVFFGHYMSEQSPAFHGEMLRLILREGAAAEAEWTKNNGLAKDGIIIAAPRGHAKSTFGSLIVPIKWAVHRTKKFIVIVSNTDSQAETIAENLRREFEANKRLLEVFGSLRGDRFRDSPYRWTNQDFTVAISDPPGSTDAKDVVWTTRFVIRGMFGKLRGLRSGASRPDALILDDAENDEHVRTAEQRQKLWDFFTKALLPMLDPKSGTLVVVGTVLHYDSLLNRLLKMPDIYVVRKWKAIERGVLLWRERFSEAKLAALREQLGGYQFSSEYLNEPIDVKARKFKPEWVQWYSKEDLKLDRSKNVLLFRGKPLHIVAGVDQAIEEKEDKAVDESAIVVVGVTEDRQLVVLYVWHQRVDFPAQVAQVKVIAGNWGVALSGIEQAAYQRALGQQLIHDGHLSVRQLKNTTPKYERITAMSIPFEEGRVYFRRCTDAVGPDGTMLEPGGMLDELQQVRVHHTLDALYEQLMQFPVAPHDDIVDALCNALQVTGAERAFSTYKGGANAAT